MINVCANQNFDKVDEFVAAYNKARVANKNKWIYYNGMVCGKEISIKSFGLWAQIFRINGIDYAFNAQSSVTNWKETLQKSLV